MDYPSNIGDFWSLHCLLAAHAAIERHWNPEIGDIPELEFKFPCIPALPELHLSLKPSRPVNQPPDHASNEVNQRRRPGELRHSFLRIV
jgi:hypothetical protein